MASNLPPGVTTSMLPGNTSEYAAWEKFCEWACDELAGNAERNDHMLTIEEAYMAVRAGIAAVIAIRGDVVKQLTEARQDERLSCDMGSDENR